MISLSVASDIVLRTIAVYLVVFLGLRLSGKREIGQVTILDLVVLLLLANAVQSAMVGPDTSLAGGIIAAVVLLVSNVVMARARIHWPQLRRLIEGSPTLLILHGEPLEEHLHHEGIDHEILQTALREHGIARVADVEMAVLEIDGSISVVPAGVEIKQVKRQVRQFRRT